MFKSIIASVLFVFAVVSSPAFAQTQDADLAKKIELANSYLGRDKLNYLVEGIDQGSAFKAYRDMSPRDGTANFYGKSACNNGQFKANFSVDKMTGEVVVEVTPRADFCKKLRYRFDPLTKKGTRVFIDRETKQETPDDPTMKFTLND
jgi:hypothetical protein